MRGIHTLRLYSKLTGSQFSFFIGLILRANELGFRNPLELTNNEALALTSDIRTQEGLRSMRNRLAKVKVYGQWLLRVRNGNRWKKRTVSYSINYNFLMLQTKIWQRTTTSYPIQVGQDHKQEVRQDHKQDIQQGVGHVLIDQKKKKGRKEEKQGSLAPNKENNEILLTADRREEEEDHDLLVLIERIENRFSNEPDKVEQYRRWLKPGIRDGELNIALIIDSSRPGRVIKQGNGDDSDMLNDLTDRLSDGSIDVMKILDGIWSAKQETVSTTGWFKWIYNHVDQWDHFHKDDPGVVNSKTRGSEERRDRTIEIRELLNDDYLATDKNRRTFQSLLEIPIERTREFIDQARGAELRDDDLMRHLDELMRGGDKSGGGQ